MPARKSTKSSIAGKNEACVDTSALIAFADRSDSYHALFRRLFNDPPRLPSSLLKHTAGSSSGTTPTRGLQFLSMIEAMPLHIEPVGCASSPTRI
jgi:hypothetical protein